MSDKLAHFAELLLDAQDNHHTVELPSASTELSLDDAYAIQERLIAARLERGERIIGAKLGFTSLAKQQAMGVHEPIFGVLTDVMRLREGAHAPLAELIHPRVEPEIVFVLGDALKGPGVDRDAVLAATASIHVGLEVIDSRFEGYSFTHMDVVADNTSAARFVLSERALDKDVDLIAIPVAIERDGKVEETATGAAVMDDPAHAVALLANWLGARDKGLEAGAIILSGGLTNAYGISAGTTVRAVFGDFDAIEISALG